MSTPLDPVEVLERGVGICRSSSHEDEYVQDYEHEQKSSSNEEQTYVRTRSSGRTTPLDSREQNNTETGDSPRYMTRQTVREMAKKNEVKRSEKDECTHKSSQKNVDVDERCQWMTNHPAHEIVSQFTDKQIELCNQICVLNAELYDTQNQLTELKGKYKQKCDALCNIGETISLQYRGTVESLTEHLDNLNERLNTMQDQQKDTKNAFYTLLFASVMMCMSSVAMNHVNDIDIALPNATDQLTNWVTTMFAVV